MNRPKHFSMTIQGGMLEALGINMYTSIGKCLVEFVANGYDSEASRVEISIPVTEINENRAKARRDAKADVEAGKRDTFSILTVPLPEDVKIVITDDGHGMPPSDVQDKFLPINRKRREDSEGNESLTKSVSGARQVMGRKGLGKLAGFGAAELVTIWTKREGEDFATVCSLDYNQLERAENIVDQEIPAKYETNLPKEEKGTKITLSRLKCDSVKYGEEAITNTLRQNFFGIDPNDFQILVNGNLVEQEDVAYEYRYPEDALEEGGFARKTIDLGDAGELSFGYVVKFRARKDDPSDIPGIRGHLAAAKRGARIYCKGRLAAGPTLLDLPTGMHNFHSQSYMECIVHADELDNHSIDLINTNRTQLREDNEVVQAFVADVTEIMRRAIQGHARYREEKADIHIADSKSGAFVTAILKQVPVKQREPARRLLRMLSVTYGANSSEFTEMAPVVMDSLNASSVLIRLIKLGSDPDSLSNVAAELLNLEGMERRDVLKLYRGRRNGINALRKLIDKGREIGRAGPHFEDQLHGLFKANPWLIKPEYSRYLTSNQDMSSIAARLAKELVVDEFAPPMKEGAVDYARPDLVFLMTDSDKKAQQINVVELKSPSIALDVEHLNQLKRYRNKVREFVDSHMRRAIPVHGYLIGKMPKVDTSAQGSKDLLQEIKDRGISGEWDVLDLEQLLERAYVVHAEEIEVLEQHEANENI